MATFKCEKCGREFKSDRALKVHIGMAHGSKSKTRRKSKKKAARTPRKGKFVCKVCGRSFKMAMHLARHMTAAHGKKRRKAVKKTRRVVRVTAGVPRGLKVDTLSIDQLLAVKKAVDTRLSGIARKMRQVKLR